MNKGLINNLQNCIAIAVFLISFSVYVFTLNPSISAADSNEIVTTAIILGIPHQPSYPVNTILGHLFSKVPYGTLPWRVNLMSAVFQAMTVTLIYFVILKLYKGFEESRRSGGEQIGKYFLAASAALFLAFSREFWQFATRAEVFPLNNFFGALLTLIIVSWWEKVRNCESGIGNQESKNHNSEFIIQNSGPVSPSRRTLQKYSFLTKYLPQEALERWSAYRPPPKKIKNATQKAPLGLLYLFAFVAGLAFTHHQTIIFLGPAFLYILVRAGTHLWWRKEVLVKLFACLALGILPYFFLLIPMARADPEIKWGEPVNIQGAVRALLRTDYGTFSPYAQNPTEIEGQKPKETPISQQVFYVKSLNRDFTLLGLVLAFLGGFYLFRQRRKVFYFIFLGFFFVGPFFLGFANWTLESGFHEAIVKRFQMLPDLYFTLFLAFGFFFIWESFRQLKINLRERKNLLVGILIVAGLTSTFFYPFIRNFKDADNRGNYITFKYAYDALGPTPKDAIVLISGDVTTFAFEYWQTIVEPDNQRIIFSPGLLYLDWYVTRLKKKYPQIVIPPAQPGHLQASTTEIIKANWGERPIYISPELARYDPQVQEDFVLWPKHLLFFVKTKGEDLKLEPYRQESDNLWQSYDLGLFEKIRKNNPLLEYAVVPEYARYHFNMGSVFESVHLYDDAIREYNRALKIHPAFPDPYKNLGRVYGFKLKEKDYQQAFDNFNMFLVTALPSQKEDVEAVKEAMAQLQEGAATRSAQLQEASESGKVATSSSEEK